MLPTELTAAMNVWIWHQSTQSLNINAIINLCTLQKKKSFLLSVFGQILSGDVMTTYQRRGQLDKGKASVLSGLLVFDKADVAGWQISVWCQGCHNALNSRERRDVPQDDCCNRQSAAWWLLHFDVFSYSITIFYCLIDYTNKDPYCLHSNHRWAGFLWFQQFHCCPSL